MICYNNETIKLRKWFNEIPDWAMKWEKVVGKPTSRNCFLKELVDFRKVLVYPNLFYSSLSNWMNYPMLYHHIPVWLLPFQPFLRLLLLAKIPNIDSDSDFHLLEGVLIFLICLQFYPQPIVYYLTWFIIEAESNVTDYTGNIIFYLRVYAILWGQWRNRPIRIPSASFSSERSFVK